MEERYWLTAKGYTFEGMIEQVEVDTLTDPLALESKIVSELSWENYC